MPANISDEKFNALLACPVSTCHSSQLEVLERSLRCQSCGEEYPRLTHTLEMIPAASKEAFATWDAWTQLQDNGNVAYQANPEINLGVGVRPDCTEFNRFCSPAGIVLDVGCGPQDFPAYLTEHADDTVIIGVDPLTEDRAAPIRKLRALGELLPFRDGVFDQVISATSLDHMLDVTAVVRDMERVCRPGGQVLVWCGEKSPDAPKPPQSPEWFTKLVRPEGAEDHFHMKRLSDHDVREAFSATGLFLEDSRSIPVDQWRTNHFYRYVKK